MFPESAAELLTQLADEGTTVFVTYLPEFHEWSVLLKKRDELSKQDRSGHGKCVDFYTAVMCSYTKFNSWKPYVIPSRQLYVTKAAKTTGRITLDDL